MVPIIRGLHSFSSSNVLTALAHFTSSLECPLTSYVEDSISFQATWCQVERKRNEHLKARKHSLVLSPLARSDKTLFKSKSCQFHMTLQTNGAILQDITKKQDKILITD